MIERRALGKGIGALIPERPLQQDAAPASGGEAILRVKITQVRPNPLQPREHFDAEGMDALVQSIREKGLIQPVVVRRKGDQYELIAGERRLRACQALGLTEIPVIVKDAEDQDSLELSLIENIQRQDLNSVEEARAYQYLIEKFQISQERLSEILGKARATIANTLRILGLPQEIQEEIRKGRLTFAHGRALLELSDSNQQRRLAQEIISRGLSIRELESLIKTRRPRNAKIKFGRMGTIDPAVAVLEEALQHTLATKVRIIKQKKRGHITIEFYSPQELQRIASAIITQAKA
jgi:ParB family chromosome partitioning protein